MARIKDEKLNNDFENAPKFDKLRVGNYAVYYPDGLKIRVLRYGEDFDHAFIRINEVNGKLCCGSTTFAYYRMVFCKDGKELCDYLSENEAKMDDALAAIAARDSSIKIGV